MTTQSPGNTPDFSIAGKVVFITGASSGIGAACAARFAGAGAKVLLAARRADRLRDMAAALDAALASNVRTMTLDVRDSKQVQAAIESLPEAWRAIDVLINNAGLSRGLDKIHEGSVGDWDEMIDTNVKGLLYVTRAVLPGMVQRGAGHVVNIGSTAGHWAYPKGAVYCGTKAAEQRMTEGMRQDLLGTAVRVTSIDPGMVETEFSKVRFRGNENRAAKVYQGLTPLQPEDVADAVLWAVTRPAHVNIAEIMLTTVDQADSVMFNRRTD